MRNGRFSLMGCLGLAALPVIAAHAGVPADRYPFRPVRFIVPYAPGGGGDILTRALGAKLGEFWGQSVIIDNRGGGGTVLGTDMMAKAPRDGYTILLSTNTHAINATLRPNLPYDPIKDFQPVTLLATAPNILLTNPSLPAKTVKDLLAYAKGNPGKLNYGSSGNGGTGHLAMELLRYMTGVNLVHIPYNGGGPAMNALLSNEVSLLFNNILAAVPQVKSGRVNALGVTSLRRSSAVPDVPTIAESGVPGFEAVAWFCVFAPAGTPPEIVTKLNRDIVRALRLPDVLDRLTSQGLEPVGNGVEEFGRFMRAEIDTWGKVIRSAGIVAD
jgi:tripartite-type tricarboxylate transporter receptor subunit TctC